MDNQQDPHQYQPQVMAPQPVPAPRPSWSEISGQPANGSGPGGFNTRKLAGTVAALVLLAVIGAVIWHVQSKDTFASRIKNGPETSHLAPVRPATADTPLGRPVPGSGGAEGLVISVNRVLPNPGIAGDKPDAGTGYLEIDLTVRNTSRLSMIVPGTFYYQTGGGKLLSTATSTGDKSAYANKNVEVVGRDSLDGLSLDPGRTDSTHYLIFQIPASEMTGSKVTGKLVWYDGYYDTRSDKLAIFDL